MIKLKFQVRSFYENCVAPTGRVAPAYCTTQYGSAAPPGQVMNARFIIGATDHHFLPPVTVVTYRVLSARRRVGDGRWFPPAVRPGPVLSTPRHTSNIATALEWAKTALSVKIIPYSRERSRYLSAKGNVKIVFRTRNVCVALECRAGPMVPQSTDFRCERTRRKQYAPPRRGIKTACYILYEQRCVCVWSR